MKLFGRKTGRDESRPVLELRATRFADGAGAVPASYQEQVRALYLRNAVAQRAVRMIAIAGAVIAWISGATLEAARQGPGGIRARRAIVHAVLAAVAVIAVAALLVSVDVPEDNAPEVTAVALPMSADPAVI